MSKIKVLIYVLKPSTQTGEAGDAQRFLRIRKFVHEQKFKPAKDV